jgi:hypothetical protein
MLKTIFGVAAAHVGLVTASVLLAQSGPLNYAIGVGLVSLFNGAACGTGLWLAGSYLGAKLAGNTSTGGKEMAGGITGAIAGAAGYLAGAGIAIGYLLKG